MLNFAPEELRPRLTVFRQWHIVLWRLVAVVSVQRAVEDDVHSVTANVAWAWRDG